jgi:hypothetical protein
VLEKEVAEEGTSIPSRKERDRDPLRSELQEKLRTDSAVVCRDSVRSEEVEDLFEVQH